MRILHPLFAEDPFKLVQDFPFMAFVRMKLKAEQIKTRLLKP